MQVMSTIHRRGILLLLVVLPDGSRSLIPANWTNWESAGDGPSASICEHRDPCLAPLADLLHAGDRRRSPWPLPDSAPGSQRPMRRVAMQLTLTFLDLPPPAQQPQSSQLDAKTRAEALDILARIIAQAFETTKKTEAADE